MKSKINLLLVGLFLALPSSAFSYAHYSHLKSVAKTIIDNNHGTSLICVENRAENSITSKQMLVETRLGILMWLVAADYHDPYVLKNIAYKESCTGRSFILKVEIPSQIESRNDDEYSYVFIEPRAKCHSRERRSPNCKPENVVYGYTEFAGRTFWKDKLKDKNSAKIAFNSFFNWQSLESELREYGNKRLAKDYKRLVDSKNFYITEYIELVNSLNSLEFISEFESVAEKTLDTARELTGYNRIFDQPKMSLFSTLVHEMGHAFGLDHADNPKRSSFVGDGLWQRNSVDDYRTDDAIMSYAKRYNSLTEDDELGIKVLLRKIGLIYN